MDTRKTISFYGTCSARSELCLVSGRIGTPFATTRIRATFAPGCQNLLTLRFYASEDASAPTSGRPTGASLLADYGQVDYLVGDGETKDVEHQKPVAESGTWLKVHAANDDYYDHAVDVQLIIDVEPRKGA